MPEPAAVFSEKFGLPPSDITFQQRAAQDIWISRWDHLMRETPDAATPHDTLVRMRNDHGARRLNGGRLRDAAAVRGHIGSMAQGAYGSWHFLPDRPFSCTHLYFPPGWLRMQAEMDGHGSAFEMQEELQLDDPVLVRLFTELDTALDGARPSKLFVDGLVTAMAARLIVRVTGAGHPVIIESSRSPSADWRVRRTIEHLEARLGSDVGLAEIAAEVGLTPRHYTRLFQAATGLPPHAWVMRRRIEHACELLADPARTVTDVALELGFASSQHFATTFRKHTGQTPSNYRQCRRF